eukprot:gene3617-4145_t
MSGIFIIPSPEVLSSSRLFELPSDYHMFLKHTTKKKAVKKDPAHLKTQEALQRYVSKAIKAIPMENVTEMTKKITMYMVEKKKQPNFFSIDWDAEPPLPTPSFTQSYNADGELDWDMMTIKGTSTDLEKPYLRLTSAPDPSTVRPEPSLKRTFDYLKRQWKEKEDYIYICEQFRSLRQDLTVQRIKNQFTIDVYETHARLALENGDLGQFNQCQTQLFELYKLPNVKGSVAEFFAYRVLYCIHQNNTTELSKQDCVKHALKIRRAFADNNYSAYFKLSKASIYMENYLLDKITPRIRITALQVLTKSYRPAITIEQVVTQLGFESERLAREYLLSNRFVFSDKQRKEMDCKTNIPIALAMVPPVASVMANEKL